MHRQRAHSPGLDRRVGDRSGGRRRHATRKTGTCSIFLYASVCSFVCLFAYLESGYLLSTRVFDMIDCPWSSSRRYDVLPRHRIRSASASHGTMLSFKVIFVALPAYAGSYVCRHEGSLSDFVFRLLGAVLIGFLVLFGVTSYRNDRMVHSLTCFYG